MKIRNTFAIIIISILCFFSFSACAISMNSEDVSVLNNITERDIITASIKVRSVGKQVVEGGKKYYEGADGSGVIFKKEELFLTTYYYALTNNHVIYDNVNGYRIYDCYGNEITDVELVCHDANYDLAVIRFKEKLEDVPYKVLPFSNGDIKPGEKVVVMGNPLGKLNMITMGKVEGYKEIKISQVDALQTNVEFPVIKHTAPINNGSSGGVLLNYDYEICGINYACDRDSETDEFVNGYAVQTSKILEFLSNNQIAL